MSAYPVRPEVTGSAANRREWPECMVRPRVARRFRRPGGERSCINVSGLCLERCSGPSWISARMRSD